MEIFRAMIFWFLMFSRLFQHEYKFTGGLRNLYSAGHLWKMRPDVNVLSCRATDENVAIVENDVWQLLSQMTEGGFRNKSKNEASSGWQLLYSRRSAVSLVNRKNADWYTTVCLPEVLTENLWKATVDASHLRPWKLFSIHYGEASRIFQQSHVQIGPPSSVQPRLWSMRVRFVPGIECAEACVLAAQKKLWKERKARSFKETWRRLTWLLLCVVSKDGKLHRPWRAFRWEYLTVISKFRIRKWNEWSLCLLRAKKNYLCIIQQSLKHCGKYLGKIIGSRIRVFFDCTNNWRNYFSWFHSHEWWDGALNLH